MVVIYAAVGLAVGGFDLPGGVAGWTMITAGLALSMVVRLLRGRATAVWGDADGRVWRRGTVRRIDDGAGFGEVLVMIALMFAVQAELIWRGARRLAGGRPVSSRQPLRPPAAARLAPPLRELQPGTSCATATPHHDWEADP
jgi:hypothetical protein